MSLDLFAYQRSINGTELTVSPLGLGTVKFGRNKGVKYPRDFDIPDDRQILDLLEKAWDLGINFLDTAPAYGNSEQRLGELLSKRPKPWVIATKVGERYDERTGASTYDFSPEFLHQSIERSLQRLRCEVLDIVLIHSNGNDVEIIEHYGALEVLNELKQKGLIKAIGMSSKTPEGGMLALNQADIVMVMHNLTYTSEQVVIEQAQRQAKSILIKKALNSGHLNFTSPFNKSDPIKAQFDFIYQNPAIVSIIIGTINCDHLIQNTEKALAALETKS